MRPNTKSTIYLKHYDTFLFPLSVCVLNVCPKTTLLLPVWPRDANRLDTPGPRPSINWQNDYQNLQCSEDSRRTVFYMHLAGHCTLPSFKNMRSSGLQITLSGIVPYKFPAHSLHLPDTHSHL